MSANTFNIMNVNVGKEGSLDILEDISIQKLIFTLRLNKGCYIKTAVFLNQQNKYLTLLALFPKLQIRSCGIWLSRWLHICKLLIQTEITFNYTWNAFRNLGGNSLRMNWLHCSSSLKELCKSNNGASRSVLNTLHSAVPKIVGQFWVLSCRIEHSSFIWDTLLRLRGITPPDAFYNDESLCWNALLKSGVAVL